MRPLLTLLTITLFALPAQAQSRETKGSVSAVGGIGTTYDDESSLGRGWLAGGAVDRVMFGTTRIEGSIDVLTHDRSSGYFLSSGQTVIGGVSLLHRFGRGTAQPYAFGGLTLGHHSGDNTFVTDRVSVSSTDAGWRAGGGVAFPAGAGLEIGPELRWNGFFSGTESAPWMAPSLGIRVSWKM